MIRLDPCSKKARKRKDRANLLLEFANLRNPFLPHGIKGTQSEERSHDEHSPFGHSRNGYTLKLSLLKHYPADPVYQILGTPQTTIWTENHS